MQGTGNIWDSQPNRGVAEFGLIFSLLPLPGAEETVAWLT